MWQFFRRFLRQEEEEKKEDKLAYFNSKFVRGVIDPSRPKGLFLTLIDRDIKHHPFYFTAHQTNLLRLSLEKLTFHLNRDRDIRGMVFIDDVFADQFSKTKVKCVRDGDIFGVVIWQDWWDPAIQKWIRGYTDNPEDDTVKMVRLYENDYLKFLNFITPFCK